MTWDLSRTRRFSGTIEESSAGLRKPESGSPLMDRDISTIAGTDVAQVLTTHVQQSANPKPSGPLRGSVLVLIQYDVCEEIRLDELRRIFPARTAEAHF